ncbi:MAG: hypothetical protein ACYCQK_06280, partial [Acidiferrobacteraceae bacterium]
MAEFEPHCRAKYSDNDGHHRNNGGREGGHPRRAYDCWNAGLGAMHGAYGPATGTVLNLINPLWDQRIDMKSIKITDVGQIKNELNK